jgi:hypothetical protein
MMTSTSAQAVLAARMGRRPDAPARNLAHVALVYRPGDGPAAAELLGLFAFELVDMGPHRETDEHWYSVFVDAGSTFEDNLVYLIPASPAQLALESHIARTRGADPELDAAWSAFDGFSAGDPERSFHFGFTYGSFDELETAARAVLAAGAPGGSLAGRVWKRNVFRPTPGFDPAIDERLAGSPLVADDDRRCLAPNGFQLWFGTDLLASNLLAVGQVLEMDHVFPRHPAG